MDDGAAIAIGVGAVVVVFLFVRMQQQKTNAMIAQQQQAAAAPSGPYALSFNDQLAVGASLFNVGKLAGMFT